MSSALYAVRVVPHPDALAQQLGDGIVLVNLQNDAVFELDRIGARVWRAIAEGDAWSGLLGDLERDYAAPRDRLETDVAALVDALLRAGLVRVADPVTGGAERVPEPMPEHTRLGWLVRWEPGRGMPPQLMVRGTEPGPRTVDSADGNRLILDGMLFERTDGLGELDSLFEARGDGAAGELRGHFSLLRWERRRDRLTVLREPSGTVSAYYVWDEKCFLFSSNLDVLLGCSDVDPALDRVRLSEYLLDRWHSEQIHETFFRSVRRLPAGHRLTLERSQHRVERYWDPWPAGASWATAEEIDAVIPVLRRAIQRSLEAGADSIALSGGFDSISLALLAAEQLGPGRSLHALSLRFEHPGCDESETQVTVARRLGWSQTLARIRPQIEGPELVRESLAFSASLPNPALSPWVAAYTRSLRGMVAAGHRSILFGTGGDELFNVHESHALDLIRRRDLLGLYGFIRAWQRTSPLPAWRVAKHLLYRVPARAWLSPALGRALPRSVSRGLRALRTRKHARLTPPDPGLAEALEERAQSERLRAPGTGHTYYGGEMLRMVDNPLVALDFDDAAAWGRSVGFVRLVPFFDQDVWQLVLRLPPEALYAEGRMKSPLRQWVQRSMPGLPLGTRKVDFTQGLVALLRHSLPGAWEQMGGAAVLYDLGLLDRTEVRRLLDGLRDGTENWLRPWLVLSTAAWVQLRTRLSP